jgi:3-hydroxyacyl-[acyl-carrier-protein] dehydratase
MHINKNEVLNLIPQRDPFLFVNSVTSINKKKVRGMCTWQHDNPIFKGHFPDFPIVPGVCLIEAACQVAAVHISKRINEFFPSLEKDDTIAGVMAGVKRTFFHKPIRPGEELECLVKVEQAMRMMFLVKAIGRCNGKKKFFCRSDACNRSKKKDWCEYT